MKSQQRYVSLTSGNGQKYNSFSSIGNLNSSVSRSDLTSGQHQLTVTANSNAGDVITETVEFEIPGKRFESLLDLCMIFILQTLSYSVRRVLTMPS